MEDRLQQFERMLAALQEQYRTTTQQMDRLKAQGKEKSATYRQLLGNKLMYRQFLTMYRVYGLLGDEPREEVLP